MSSTRQPLATTPPSSLNVGPMLAGSGTLGISLSHRSLKKAIKQIPRRSTQHVHEDILNVQDCNS